MAATTTCTLTLLNDKDAEYEDDYWYPKDIQRAVRAPLGTSRLARDVVPLLHEWIARDSRCRRRELMVLGKALYDIAFGTDKDPRMDVSLREAFERTLKDCRTHNNQVRLRLVLTEDAKALSTYPWEFLFMESEGGGFFLAGEDTRLTLTRYIPNAETWERAADDEERLRILIVESTPAIPTMTDLKVTEFVRDLVKLDMVQTTHVKSPTKSELIDHIERVSPHVIHFIGHGRDGTLAVLKDPQMLADERRVREDLVAQGHRPPPVSEAVWLDAYTASDVLKAGLDEPGAPHRLVFLHACEGATSTENNAIGAFNDVARKLASVARITGVIAMQYTIGVEEAELFARSFYEAISQGSRVDEAVRVARREFAQSSLGGREQSWDSRGFGTPVSYLRSEQAMISRRGGGRPSPVTDSTPPDPAPLVQKEPCPNDNCEGLVRRTASVLQCRVCGEAFTECPSSDCRQPHDGRRGLVVARARMQCNNCGYKVPDPALQNVRVLRQSMPVEVAGSHRLIDGPQRAPASAGVESSGAGELVTALRASSTWTPAAPALDPPLADASGAPKDARPGQRKVWPPDDGSGRDHAHGA